MKYIEKELDFSDKNVDQFTLKFYGQTNLESCSEKENAHPLQ